MSNQITLEDIKKAMEVVNDPKHIIRETYDWGWIDFNQAFQPINIGLNKSACDEVNALMLRVDDKSKLENAKVTEIFGIPVYVSAMK